MSTVQPIPAGFSSATPNRVVDGGGEAIDFSGRAFGAEVRTRQEAGGMLVRAALRIAHVSAEETQRGPAEIA